MKTLVFGRCALGISLAASMLTGCRGSQPPIGAPSVVPLTAALAARTDSTNYKVVYSFGGGSDGATPEAGVIYVGGTLYGTTGAGGSGSCADGRYHGCGTVFSVTPGGAEKVLHSFGGESDGENPQAGLVDVGGVLYGTTALGGAYTCTFYCGIGGTVFSITRGGTEKVLHSFRGYSDGSTPYAGLINVKRTLYGTTEGGGTPVCYSGSNPGCGVVFGITTAGTERVLYDFSGSPDGAYADAGLIDLKGVLYGTTRGGGTRGGGGTVFSITPDGHEKVLHRFGSGEDGWSPQAGLLNVDGKLYGDTSRGGAYRGGTVFSITPGGKEKVVHSFGFGSDSANPYASLIELNGKLYGTTGFGGAYSCGSQVGCGTVFSITTSGTEKVLHSFGQGCPSACNDGREPFAGLIDVNGTFYGTTTGGGAHGYGTVFSLKP